MATRMSRVARSRKSRAKPSPSPGKRNAAVGSRRRQPKAGTEPRARTDRGGKQTAKKGKTGKVIRDSFTMPVGDYELLGVLKKRCIGLGVAIKKSELLRAGLVVLERLPGDSLAKVIAAVESVKTGRPPGKKKRKKRKKKKMKNRKDRKQ